MAQAGHIMGGARGKVGDYVYQKGEKGKTIVRVKVTPANPKTIAQGKQRLAFAMATSAAAGLRFLINHSFENVKSGKLCEREFVRINARLLRAEIDAFIAGTAGFHGNAQIKGAKTLQAADYIISRGSAYFPAFHGDKSAQYGTCCKIPALGQGSLLEGTISDQTNYEQVLALIGLKPGDQISFISMYDFPTTIIQYDSETNALCKVFASRVTFKAKPDFTNITPLVVNGKISEQYIEESFGPEIKIYYKANSDEIVYSQDGEEAWGNPLQAVGIIRTTKTINGKYEYSPCQMQFLDEGNDPEIVLMSYLPQNASTTDEYFLDQAESGGGRKPAPKKPSVEITCVPPLPRNNFDNVQVTFSKNVNLEDFISHVRVKGEYEGEIYEATLTSIGSGQIQADIEGGGGFAIFQGTGDDKTYTYRDNSSSHVYLYSIEWVD